MKFRSFKSFIRHRLVLEKKAFLKIKGKIVKKSNQLIAGLIKAGYCKLTANVIALFASVLFTTPFSITTVLASFDVIGCWGVIPGLGIVEGTLIYTFAKHIRKISIIFKVLCKASQILKISKRLIHHKPTSKNILSRDIK